MKHKAKIFVLIGVMAALNVRVTPAEAATTFADWSELSQDGSTEIIVARCLKTPNPYYQEEPDSWALSFNDITNFAAFAKKLTDKSNPVSEYLMGKIAHIKPRFPPWELASTNADTLRSVFPIVLWNLNDVIYGPCIYDSNVFRNVKLRPEIGELLKKKPQGEELTKLNRMLLEDAYPGEIVIKHLKSGLLPLGPYKDGLIDSDIDVVSVLKGESQPGVSRLFSTYFLPMQGEYYLVFARQYRWRRYYATEDFRVVRLGLQFEANWIAGENFDQQITTLLKYGLLEANRQIERGQQSKSLLERALPLPGPSATKGAAQTTRTP